MSMTVRSVNFIKETDVPVRVVNTDMGKVVEQVAAAIKGGIPRGQALTFQVTGAKKYTRYQLQRRLQKMGHKIHISGKDESMYITNATDNVKK